MREREKITQRRNKKKRKKKTIANAASMTEKTIKYVVSKHDMQRIALNEQKISTLLTIVHIKTIICGARKGFFFIFKKNPFSTLTNTPHSFKLEERVLTYFHK